MEYKSFITAESGDRIENEVQFAGKSVSVQGDGGQDGIKVSLAGAGGGASTGLGQLKISKVDDEDRPLQGVIFELYNAAGTILLETLTTDVKGKLQPFEAINIMIKRMVFLISSKKSQHQVVM